jgi:hypothetical protein
MPTLPGAVSAIWIVAPSSEPPWPQTGPTCGAEQRRAFPETVVWLLILLLFVFIVIG